MKRKRLRISIGLLLATAALYGVAAPQPVTALVLQDKLNAVRTSGVPDVNGAANWANSPPLRKFVDALPGICGAGTAGENLLGQCIPVAQADTTTYPGSDYYEIEIVQYREQMHTDLPAVVGPKMDPTSTGGTLLRGYRQTNTADVDALTPHYLGPLIGAQKDRPVRIKFTNSLPTGTGGNLFIPTDTTVMGAGPGSNYDRVGIATDAEVCKATPALCYSQNRADLHLHGGRTPWISDGTAHQWITPAAETTAYPKGVSVAYVPDMWFNASGVTIPECAGKTSCAVAGATNNPGPGSQTYYYTNAQSARMMFYHDHSWGITRLSVYIGGAAGYMVTDATEAALIAAGTIPGPANTVPLVIQDKTYVNAATIVDDPATPLVANDGTDPTWIWGSQPGTLVGGYNSTGAVPVTGDLWWPHVYVPAQNPFNPDFTGTNTYGRWHYGPWFWPPTDVPYGPTTNPYYDAVNDPTEPPEMPSTPNPSWGAEAFMDTPVVNGTAYPKLNVNAEKYRFRILNAAHDRFWNLQFYVADPAQTFETRQTEVKMVPAVTVVGYPDGWPVDNREGGSPDPATRGPAMIQIGTEGGFLPKPVVLPNQPVVWNTDPTTFTAGLVLQQNQGGGTLMLGPAERADIIVDFSQFAGKTLILYNDAPAPWPALDPHYDYYTGAPDNTGMGGSAGTLIGRGPNTRTIMQIEVAGAGGTAPPDDYAPATLTALETAFAGTGGVFATGQEPLIVGQTAYNVNYGKTFPATWPTWGVSRITDNSLSFMRPDGAVVNNYPIEPKAIQDEMGEVFDDFGRMSAKLGLELAKTTAGIQTFVLQNFVDPPTEFVGKDQIQIWKITHNGVDTHPVHFHLFEVQVLNRVGWDGFIYLPDPNELGWKDTVRISPLEDTIVALRPAKIPVPFNVPNSYRPLNPAFPLGGPAGFTNIDPKTAQPLTTPVINEMFNFGNEYLWHCHILSHEEQDMMRPIILNADSLLYTDNDAAGFWQWSRGDWSLIANINPINIVASGSNSYATDANGLWEWNGYNWRNINSLAPTNMVASGSMLYANFTGFGLYKWDGSTWTLLNTVLSDSMVASGSVLYANFTGFGLYKWDGSTWILLNTILPDNNMVASGSALYVNFPAIGLYRLDGNTWTQLANVSSDTMVASGSMLFANFNASGSYQFDGSAWTQINSVLPDSMSASNNELYANFPTGLYKWDGNTWAQLASVAPNNMSASGSILYANFPASGGVWKWEPAAGGWSLLSGAPATAPTNIAAGF